MLKAQITRVAAIVAVFVLLQRIRNNGAVVDLVRDAVRVNVPGRPVGRIGHDGIGRAVVATGGRVWRKAAARDNQATDDALVRISQVAHNWRDQVSLGARVLM